MTTSETLSEFGKFAIALRDAYVKGFAKFAEEVNRSVRKAGEDVARRKAESHEDKA